MSTPIVDLVPHLRAMAGHDDPHVERACREFVRALAPTGYRKDCSAWSVCGRHGARARIVHEGVLAGVWAHEYHPAFTRVTLGGHQFVSGADRAHMRRRGWRMSEGERIEISCLPEELPLLVDYVRALAMGIPAESPIAFYHHPRWHPVVDPRAHGYAWTVRANAAITAVQDICRADSGRERVRAARAALVSRGSDA